MEQDPRREQEVVPFPCRPVTDRIDPFTKARRVKWRLAFLLGGHRLNRQVSPLFSAPHSLADRESLAAPELIPSIRPAPRRASDHEAGA